jgi:hypothetical protein
MLLNFYLKLLILYTKHLTIRITQEIFTDWFTTTTITIPYHSVRYVDLNFWRVLSQSYPLCIWVRGWGGVTWGPGGYFRFFLASEDLIRGSRLAKIPYVITDNFGKFYWMFLIQIDDILILLIIYTNYKITAFTISECV